MGVACGRVYSVDRQTPSVCSQLWRTRALRFQRRRRATPSPGPACRVELDRTPGGAGQAIPAAKQTVIRYFRVGNAPCSKPLPNSVGRARLDPGHQLFWERKERLSCGAATIFAELGRGPKAGVAGGSETRKRRVRGRMRPSLLLCTSVWIPRLLRGQFGRQRRARCRKKGGGGADKPWVPTSSPNDLVRARVMILGRVEEHTVRAASSPTVPFDF